MVCPRGSLCHQILRKFHDEASYRKHRIPYVIILSVNTFSMKMLIHEFTDIYFTDFPAGWMLWPGTRTFQRTCSGEGQGEGRIMGRKRQHKLREFTVEEGNVSSSLTLQVACLSATGAHYLFFFLWQWTKECIVGKTHPDIWHSAKEAHSVGQHQGVDVALMHLGTARGLRSGSSNQSPGAISQYSRELPVKPQASVNRAKEESKDLAPCRETHKRRRFKGGLVKRREKYTQILEESWDGF